MTEQISALPPHSVRAQKVTWEHVHPDAPEELGSHFPDQDLSFEDVMKALNPLHHLPVISTIYQAVSGDRIATGPRMVGAALLGGPAGLLIAGISAFIEEMSGGTVADHLVAAFNGLTGDDGAAPTDVIAADPDNGSGGILDAAALADLPGPPTNTAEAGNGATSTGAQMAALVPALLGTVPGAAMNAASDSPVNPEFVAADSDSKRIAQSLLLAQRAQANLLFANVRAHETARNRLLAEGDRSGGEEGQAHSNMRPADAGPVWYADAMQRALDKYRADATGPASRD